MAEFYMFHTDLKEKTSFEKEKPNEFQTSGTGKPTWSECLKENKLP